MKEASELIFLVVGLIALMGFIYLLDNTDRLRAIADAALDRVEAIVSEPQPLHKEDRLSLPCDQEGAQ
jgi:hypothetical protein